MEIPKISVREWRILFYLYESKVSSLRKVYKICKRKYIHIKKLEALGLIELYSSPLQKPYTLVKLTKKGEDVVRLAKFILSR